MNRVLFFDLLRSVAAIAVVAIHVLAPYRHELGYIPFEHWLTAVTVNGFSRWAVPVFIMITGALMLSDPRPFDASYYLKRRIGKVFIPFVVWSLFYAYLSGWSAVGFDASLSIDILLNSYQHETYYHLGFFYYFLPLYFVIPFLQIIVNTNSDRALYVLLSIWLLTTALYLFYINGLWHFSMWLYSGYLLLGYILYTKLPNTKTLLLFVAILGLLALITTVVMVVTNSIEQGGYSVGRWMSYKTINTVLAATSVFMICRYLAEKLTFTLSKAIVFISRHSLGIYILHPLFLWPMKNYGWSQGNPAWVIPLWVVISGGASLMCSWLLSRSEKTRWLLP